MLSFHILRHAWKANSRALSFSFPAAALGLFFGLTFSGSPFCLIYLPLLCGLSVLFAYSVAFTTPSLPLIGSASYSMGTLWEQRWLIAFFPQSLAHSRLSINTFWKNSWNTKFIGKIGWMLQGWWALIQLKELLKRFCSNDLTVEWQSSSLVVWAGGSELRLWSLTDIGFNPGCPNLKFPPLCVYWNYTWCQVGAQWILAVIMGETALILCDWDW